MEKMYLDNESPSAWSASGRIPVFDVLRGVAVLGTLLLAIQGFGWTDAQVSQLVRGPHGGNYWLLRVVNTVFGTAPQALFTMLFGAGMVLFLARTRPANGLSAPEQLIRRQLWLIVLGLINALVLLWPNDLLFPFAILGVLLFPFHRLPVRALLIGAVLAGLIVSGKSYWDFSEQKTKYEKYQKVVALEKKNKKNKKFKLTDEQKEDKSTWEGMAKQSQYDPKANAKEVGAMRSGYAEVWSHLVGRIQYREASWLYRYGIWEVASLMLLGMALFKGGFFTNRLSTQQYGLLAAGGLLIGQALAWLVWPVSELKQTDFTAYVRTNALPWAEVAQPFAQALTAIGWASLVMVLYRLDVAAWLWQAFRAVGQMPLTSYLLQTVLCTLFFYGYGLGYFGDLRLYQLYFVVAEIWLLQIVFSLVWMRAFRLGPAEWLLRSLVRGQRQALYPEKLIDPAVPVLS